MTKKITRNPDGPTTYTNDEGEVKQRDPCIKEAEINNIEANLKSLKKDIYEKDGMHDTILLVNAQLNSIIKSQENSKLWIRSSVIGFAVFVFGLVYFGITDHNAVASMSDRFVTNENLMKVLKEQSEFNIYLKNVDDNLKDRSDQIDKQLERIDDNFKYLRITRGLPAEEKTTGDIKYDKLTRDLLNKTK